MPPRSASREVGDSTTAFGANLLGAMVGALVEYDALVTGYQALLFVVAGLYGVAWLLRQHGLSGPIDLAASG